MDEDNSLYDQGKFCTLESPSSGCDPKLPTIPKDWEFHNLLVEISKQLTPNEIDEMKARLKGSIGRKLLEQIQTGSELFDYLQKEDLLDRDNVLLLQALLHLMNKDELFDLAVNYAQGDGNIIYMKKPPDEPPNGYTFVKIHIDGKDFSQFNWTYLEALRGRVATLMFTKPEHVVIAGLEPSNSLRITLMVPTRHVKYLERAAEELIKEWTLLEVDYIVISEKTYAIKDRIAPTESEANKQLQLLYHEYQQMKQKYEKIRIENLELQRSIQIFEEATKTFVDEVRPRKKIKCDKNTSYSIQSLDLIARF